MAGEILLVDDDPLIRTVVSDNLSDSDFTVHVASNETQAGAALEAHPGIGLAIIDYCLPRPTGIAFCRNVQARYPHVAVALYTGHGELADVRRGDDDIPVLTKTMRIEQLVAAVNDLLEGRRASVAEDDLMSRAEVLWRREAQRETVRAVGRAMHNQFDRTLKEPLSAPLSDTVLRLSRIES